ncbi:hypothetical protein FACS1894191_1310 [Clostridia bacterium]|nr:hypothetical protein FACS1894191_1310 [Clostridia bacterium]
MQFIALDNLHIRANSLFDSVSKGLASITAITKDIYNTGQGGPIALDHLACSGFIRNIGGCHMNGMR